MRSIALFSGVLVFNFFSAVFASTTCKGCIGLDQWNWEKILPKFQVVVVIFDVSFPYGDKYDVFTKFADDMATNKEILMAHVGIKDYGDRENQELGEKYGIKSKEDLPKLKIFINNRDAPIDFPHNDEKQWTKEMLTEFVRDNTDVYIGLAGCLEQFDKIAINYANAQDKQELLNKAEKIAEQLTIEKDKLAAKMYILFMKKIIQQETDFVKQEQKRLRKILQEGKLAEKKKEELSYRLNILHSFVANPSITQEKRNEL